jgi:hypothetical protein
MPELREIQDGIVRTARDAAYVAVGLGVLGFQRAQVRRQELAKRLGQPRAELEDRIAQARGELARRALEVDERVAGLVGRLAATVAPVQERLPEGARQLVAQAQAQAREARSHLRKLLEAQAASKAA